MKHSRQSGFAIASRVSRLALLCLLASSYAFGQSTAHNSASHAAIDRLYKDHVESFYIADSIGNDIYVGSRERLYHTSNGGKTWKHLGDLPNVTLIKQIIPISPRVIFVNTSKGFAGEAFLSEDSGRSFCPCLSNCGEGRCASFLPRARTLFVASEKPFELMESKDSGTTWSAAGPKIDTLSHAHICSLLVEEREKETKFFVATSAQATIYETTGLVKSWHKCFVDAWGNWNRDLPFITTWGNSLVACLASGPLITKPQIYISENDGESWLGIKCPINIWGIGVNAADTATMWVGNFGNWPKAGLSNSLQFSQNRGRTWQDVPDCKAEWFWQMLELSGGALYAATDYGLIRVKLND